MSCDPPKPKLTPAAVAALFAAPLGVALPKPTFKRVLVRKPRPIDNVPDEQLTEGQRMMRFQRQQKGAQKWAS